MFPTEQDSNQHLSYRDLLECLLAAPRLCFVCGSFLLFVFRVCHCSLKPFWSPAGKELGSLVSDFFLCFCHFPIWCSGSGAEVFFSCSTQLSTKFIVLINVKISAIVGILTIISMINTTLESRSARNFFICRYFSSSVDLSMKKVCITLGPGVVYDCIDS